MKSKIITALVAVGMMMSMANADVVSKDGIAKDTATGLMWQDDAYTQDEETNYSTRINNGKVGNWNYAKDYCENLTLSGYSDWRLPNIYELVTLLDNTKSNPAYSVDGMQNIVSKIYWSSTPFTVNQNSNDASLVNFEYGNYSGSDKKNSFYIRCVRGKQLNFNNLSLLKKSDKVKVSQKIIYEISQEGIAKQKKELEKILQSINPPRKEYISWKVAFKFDSSSGTAQTSKIECSNGKHGFAEYFYNSPGNYYVGGVMNRSLDEAANYICGNR